MGNEIAQEDKDELTLWFKEGKLPESNFLVNILRNDLISCVETGKEEQLSGITEYVNYLLKNAPVGSFNCDLNNWIIRKAAHR